MELELETTCQRCGKRFTPAHRDYVRGTWRICPACRETPAPRNPPPPSDGPTRKGER